MVLSKLRTYGKMVMFSHSLFSLSFAVFSMLLAAKGLPPIRVVLWIFVALLGARNGANALNRIIDRNIDAKNPRTAARDLPSGRIKLSEAVILTVFCFGLLALASYMLNPLCLKLLPVALLLLIAYSYTKRFTWACHIILGIACAGAPVGAWIAVTGEIGLFALVLGAANALWVAGFDIIYGTQDVDFDRAEGLFSIPAFFGIKNALIISSIFHIIAIAMLLYIYFAAPMGWIYLIGLLVIAILLFMEHYLVTPKDLNQVKLASYHLNEIVSVILLIFSTLDIFLMR